jgi:hypothetical protein
MSDHKEIIQTIIIEKKYMDIIAATSWIINHGFLASRFVITTNRIEFTQKPRDENKRVTWIPIADGIHAVVEYI